MQVSHEEISRGTLMDILDADRRRGGLATLRLRSQEFFDGGHTPEPGICPLQDLGPDLREDPKADHSRHDHDKQHQGEKLQDCPSPSSSPSRDLAKFLLFLLFLLLFFLLVSVIRS